MIKLQTAVVILSILTSNLAWATSIEDLLGRSSVCGETTAAYEKMCQSIYETSIEQQTDSRVLEKARKDRNDCLKKALARLEKCGDNSQAGACQDAQKDYIKSLTDFRNACNAAQIPSSRTTGHMACSAELYKCFNMDASPAGDTKQSLPGMRDLEGESRRMDQCALLAATDQDKVEKQVDKARDRKRELENKIPEIQEKMADSQEQTDTKVHEIANQQQEAAKEHSQQMKDSKRNMEAAQKQLGQQLAAMQEQLDGIDAQIDQLELNTTDAEAKYIDGIMQIELACHAAASQEVAKLQEVRLEKIRTNSFNRGGFSDMVKNVGVTDRQSWEREAKKRYQWCMESKPTREQKKMVLRGKELAIKSIQNARAALEKRKVGLRQQMAQIKDQGGCKTPTPNGDGTTNETEMCKALRSAFEDQQQASQEFQSKQQNLQQQQQQIILTAAKKQAMLNEQLQKASLEINDEQTRLRNLEEFFALKQLKAGGSTTATTTESTKARESYSNFLSTASTFAFACCRNDIRRKDAKCPEVKGFVEANGGDWRAYTTAPAPDDSETIVQPEAIPPTPVTN